MNVCTIDSPLGPLRAAFDASGGLTELFINDASSPRRAPRTVEEQALAAELAAYFAGEPVRFSAQLAAAGTAFQRAVWRELMNIPHGRTLAYSELAERLRRPGAARAVGAACGANPVAIVVPCHRVVGKSGTLTGYAGGLDVKGWLLRLECALPGVLTPAKPGRLC